jgi:hypothetical protein
MAGRLAATAMLGGLLALVPLPRVAWATTATFEHHQPRLLQAVPMAPGPAAAAAAQSRLDPDAAAVLLERGRRAARETVRQPFSAIGVSLAEAPAEPVLLRVRNGATWGAWQEVAIDIDHGPDEPAGGGRPGVHSDPIWVGTADAYELNLPAGARRTEVHLGRETRVRRTIEARPEPAGATPGVYGRATWGARAPSLPAVASPDFRLAVVHHSVSANDYSPAHVPAMLRAIQSFHMDVQGWSDIGYNFAVDHWGRIWEAHAGGITRAIIGGHARGFNTGSVGVVVLGEFSAAAPSTAAVNAVGELLAWKFAIHRVDPRTIVPYTTTGGTSHPAGATVNLPRIVAHRDVGSTACPGNHLLARLNTIRSIVYGRFPGELNARPPRPFVGNFDGNAGDEVLVERTGAGADELWRWAGSGFARQNLHAAGIYRPAVGDFDGNGADDVLWHGTGSSGDAVWYGSTGGFAGGGLRLDPSYVPHVGDFDGDGADDAFLYADAMGADQVLYGNTDRTLAATAVPFTGTYDPHIADFDADGFDDVFLHDPGQGVHHVLYGTDDRGTLVQRSFNALGTYRTFLGDFNGDGHGDIFWYDHTPGGDWIYYGTDARPGFRGSRFQVIGLFAPMVGDFDGNGQDDIFWYSPGNPNHVVWYFLPTGVRTRSFAAWGVFDPRPLDLNGDAFDDILWYSPAGTPVWRGAADMRFF